MTGAPRPSRSRRVALGRPVAEPAIALLAVLALAGVAAACSGGSGDGGRAGPTTAPGLVGVRGTSPFTGSGLEQEASSVAAAQCQEPTAKVLRQDKGAVVEGALAGASLTWTVCLAADDTLVAGSEPLQVVGPSGGLTGEVATATVSATPECLAADRASVQGCVHTVELTFDVTKGSGGWATDTPTTVRLAYTGTTTSGFGGIVQGEHLSGTVTIG